MGSAPCWGRPSIDRGCRPRLERRGNDGRDEIEKGRPGPPSVPRGFETICLWNGVPEPSTRRHDAPGPAYIPTAEPPNRRGWPLGEGGAGWVDRTLGTR